MTKKNLKRGEVYYIEGAKGAAGAEMVKTRPGIVISDQNQVEDSHVVTVVYISHKEQTKNRAHVPMTHEGLLGWALCEHIYTVDIDRAGTTSAPSQTRSWRPCCAAWTGSSAETRTGKIFRHGWPRRNGT